MLALTGAGMFVIGVLVVVFMARYEDNSQPGHEFPAVLALTPVVIAVIGFFIVVGDFIYRVYAG